jgi:hypothetical protein
MALLISVHSDINGIIITTNIFTFLYLLLYTILHTVFNDHAHTCRGYNNFNLYTKFVYSDGDIIMSKCTAKINTAVMQLYTKCSYVD